MALTVQSSIIIICAREARYSEKDEFYISQLDALYIRVIVVTVNGIGIETLNVR